MEIVVVVLVISLLTALLIPAMGRARERKLRADCLSNVRQIGLAFKQFCVDSSDELARIESPVARVASSSVFLSLTNGNYLAIGRIYLCPLDRGRVVGTVTSFGPSNNSYSCTVHDMSGRTGITEGVSSDTPLIIERGLAGAPGWMKNLTNATWLATSPHGTEGGNVMYVGGQAAFKKFLDRGTDGTNGYVLEP